ncbi:MAG: helix-turn-helix domain-containing protein [Anaerolineales bacterium]|nr:helix-turn-helix domain-containing protein [Anaerolineales bacterium]
MPPNTLPPDSALQSLETDGHPVAPRDLCCSSSAVVSTRIRQIRQERQISIRALATKCGVSANTISLIENDRTSPSVNTLQLLAVGLGVPLISFFEGDKAEPALIYQKHGQRPLTRFIYGHLTQLGEGLPPLGAEPILITLDPASAQGQDIRHMGREFIFCLEGKFLCVINHKEYLLTPEDSLLFDATLPHHWSNPYPETCRVLALFCQMDAQEHPAEHHLSS